jgi:hypothetical protein
MAITVVQHQLVLGAGANPFNATFTTLPTVGNVLLFGITSDDLVVFSISDNQTPQNTYVTQLLRSSSVGPYDVAMLTCVVTQAVGTFTVTITTNSTVNSVELVELAGANTVAVVDAPPGMNDHGTTDIKALNCVAGTASVVDDYLFFFFGTNDTSGNTILLPLTLLDNYASGGLSANLCAAGGIIAPVGYATGQSVFGDALGSFHAVATLIGPAGPLITTAPQNQTVVNGSTANFTIVVTGTTGTVHYQWTKNGSNVGTDSSSYTTGVLTPADDLSSINCTVTDDAGSNIGGAAMLRVINVPPIAWTS